MHFDRDKLEEEVLEKVKEVNEESGYRPYFELPEYVHIVASIMEEKFRVEYDDLVNQIHLLGKELDKAQIKAENLEEENEYLSDFKAAAEEELKDWEACADSLFVYAMETLSTATNMALYEVAKEDVLVYNRLKNGGMLSTDSELIYNRLKETDNTYISKTCK